MSEIEYVPATSGARVGWIAVALESAAVLPCGAETSCHWKVSVSLSGSKALLCRTTGKSTGTGWYGP